MRFLCASFAAFSFVCVASASADDKTKDLTIGGVPWAKTVITPYDASTKESRDATFKVYTHVMDFAGKEPITKGLGGLYPHHRGLFIGWRVTTIGDKKFDTWHMTDCYQVFDKTIAEEHKGDSASQTLRVLWKGNDGTPILSENRTIAAKPGPNNSRIFDFTSTLTADNDTTLRGDSHHAGMQIRLSNEVADHQKETVYILPDGAKRLENDEASGAAWAVCNVSIGGRKYSVMHMTPPTLPAKLELYSIRPYARFGAFFQPDLKKGVPATFTTRVVVSESPIDLAAANKLYADYRNAATK